MPVEVTDEQRELADEIGCKFHAADALHKRYREHWDRLNGLYHARKGFLAAHAGASERDRDSVMQDGRKEFGAELLIPYGFSVVETTLPRMVSHRPKMIWTPRNQASEANVENVTLVCNAQQHKADYELKLQTTYRSGLIYGLGVQKVGWRREVKQTKQLQRRAYGDHDGAGKYAIVERESVLWDDPDVQDVSIYDFMWDPYGDCMANVGWVIHRSWRSTGYVLAKIASGQWGEIELEAADLEVGGGKAQYASLWASRWDSRDKTIELKEPVHEVWEFHNGQQVITVINRMYVVSIAENPAWHGELPFHIFRPTEVLHEFVGKGEIEPMEELEREMNMLRSDRRWNAMMAGQQSFFYEDGTLDPDTVRIGPGIMNPVNGNGIPLRDMLVPVTAGDIPQSGYREEQALQADIERVTGISDPVSGRSGAEETATGVQLIQAAAGLRIQTKARRGELELIKPAARQWLALNQQRITEEREVAVPATGKPGEPDRRWSWRTIGPEQLRGEFDVEPDGGSTAPENTPQLRADAQMKMGLLQVPGIDPRKMLMSVLEDMGFKSPESVLAPEVHVPPQTLELIAQTLAQGGMAPEMVNEVIGGSLNAALDAEQQQAGGGGPPPAEPEQPPEEAVAA